MSFRLSFTEAGQAATDVSAERLRHELTHYFDISGGRRHRARFDSLSSQDPSKSCQTRAHHQRYK
jgi:hypothetical protein